MNFNVLGKCFGLPTQLKMNVHSNALWPPLLGATLHILLSKHSYLRGKNYFIFFHTLLFPKILKCTCIIFKTKQQYFRDNIIQLDVNLTKLNQ